MLELLGRHSLIDLKVQAKGDLHIDPHHTVEDVGLALGMALEQALGDKRGIRRYGFFIAPMDESLGQVALDLSGRPAFVMKAVFNAPAIGEFPTELVEEFFKSLANSAKMNLHIHTPYGNNNHHLAEAIFKGFARALRMAVEIDPRVPNAIPSTKGSL
jgi:imidazoleglycerol-phosphate dehydratase